MDRDDGNQDGGGDDVYIVLRLEGDSRQLFAGKTLEDVMRLANPSRGELVEFQVLEAPSAAAARKRTRAGGLWARYRP